MAQVELYDVIVVGTRAAGRAAAAQLVDAIARKHRLAPGAVALGLERGIVEIHRSLIKTEAIAAARGLHDLGAVAELRAARDVSGVLNIEPDPEGAPPPAAATTRTAERRSASMPSVSGPADLPPPPPSFGVFEPAPRSAESSPRMRAPEPAPAAAPAASRRSEPKQPPASAAPIDDAAPTISAATLNSGPVAPRFAPPSAGERIELDLASAGLSAAPVGTSALSRSRPKTGETRRVTGTELPAVPETAATSGRFASATSGRFASDSMHASASLQAAAQFEAIPLPGLFAPDRVLSVLISAVGGTVLGVVLAFGWVRGEATETSEKLEQELAASSADPIAVEDGRARAPDVIDKELDGKLADLRQTFFLVWAAIALPLAGVGAIPRPNG